MPTEGKMWEVNYYNYRRPQNNILKLHGPSLRLDSPVRFGYHLRVWKVGKRKFDILEKKWNQPLVGPNIRTQILGFQT